MFLVFIDFGYIVVGVLCNCMFVVNVDLKFFDLGLCGFDWIDLKDCVDYCGCFCMLLLCNVVLCKMFFYNGVIYLLEDVVCFYV